MHTAKHTPALRSHTSRTGSFLPFSKMYFSLLSRIQIYLLFVLGGRSLACGRASLASDSRREEKLPELRAPAAATGLVPTRPTRQRQTRGGRSEASAHKDADGSSVSGQEY